MHSAYRHLRRQTKPLGNSLVVGQVEPRAANGIGGTSPSYRHHPLQGVERVKETPTLTHHNYTKYSARLSRYMLLRTRRARAMRRGTRPGETCSFTGPREQDCSRNCRRRTGACPLRAIRNERRNLPAASVPRRGGGSSTPRRVREGCGSGRHQTRRRRAPGRFWPDPIRTSGRSPRGPP
jgi:hypothetical protein